MSQISGRIAWISEEADSVWLLLSEPDIDAVARDCWLFNLSSAPSDPELASYRARSLPPPVPAQFVMGDGTRTIAAALQARFTWSADGEAVLVEILDEALGYCSADMARGMSRHLVRACAWGTPWCVERISPGMATPERSV
jgi:hypothetical protein